MFAGLLNLLNVFRRISIVKHFSLKIYLISQNVGHCMLWYHGLDFLPSHLLVVEGSVNTPEWCFLVRGVFFLLLDV